MKSIFYVYQRLVGGALFHWLRNMVNVAESDVRRPESGVRAPHPAAIISVMTSYLGRSKR